MHPEAVLVAVEVVTVPAVLEEHIGGVDGSGGGVVHVHPAGTESGVSEFGRVGCPPLARFGKSEVGEYGFAGPNEADEGISFGVLAEDILLDAVVINAVSGFGFHAGVNDGDDANVVFGEFFGSAFHLLGKK